MTFAFQHLSLDGKRAVVCGASKGIGRSAANLLAQRGATVVLLARSNGALDQLATAIRDDGGKAEVVQCDLDDAGDVSRAIRTILATGPVHIVVHNTGGPKGGPLTEAQPGALEGALRRHLFSAHQMMQGFLPSMRAEGYGRFINVLSTSVREPIPNLGVSNLTRAAMASWSKTLAGELPPGITINNVLPGFTDTDRLTELGKARAERSGGTLSDVQAAWRAQVPEGRLAQPWETAETIAFLASPAAAYIRGHSIPVDGGRLKSIS